MVNIAPSNDLSQNSTLRIPITAMDLLAAYDNGSSLNRQQFLSITELATAEKLQQQCVAMRVTRGEQPVGMKIGFTNRDIWPLYNVNHPIWAPVYRETVEEATANVATLRLKNFCEPRIEPEIVLGLKHAMTPASASIEDVFACLDWVAPGYEIVQSPFADWKFTVAESFAAQGLHGRLFIGSKLMLSKVIPNASALDIWLAKLQVTLRCNGQAVATGRGSNVLDSPLQALCHLVAELAKRGQQLQAGAIITTGTLTDAQPIKVGEQWSTQFDNNSLPSLQLNIV
jgi:2-keto-4-pentenoate hydratase